MASLRNGRQAARLFLELARRSFQLHLTYRAAALAGLITNLFFGLVRAAILLGLYGQRQEVAGMTVQEVVTYTGLTQAVIAYLSLFGWYELMETVYTGEVAGDLLKPMNLFTFWLGRDLGRAAAALLLRGVTVMFCYALVYEIIVPYTAGRWLALAAAVILSWLVSFSWNFLINLAAFWIPNARGIGRFGFIVAWFLSGFLMPLRFFPEWVVRVANLTPFPHMVNTVVDVYLGDLAGRALLQALLFQALWAVALIVLGQLVLRAAVRRLVILGG